MPIGFGRDPEIRDGAERDDLRQGVVEGMVWDIGPELGIGAGTDPAQHGVADRLPGRSFPFFGGDRVHLLVALGPRGNPGVSVGQDIGLGGRHAGPALGTAARAVADHRVALALVLAQQVVDQPGEEEPEHVKCHLGDVEIAGECAGLHRGTSAF